MADFETELPRLENTACYKFWAYQLQMYLDAKGLLGHITGSEPEPAVPEVTMFADDTIDASGYEKAMLKFQKDHKRWIRKDEMTCFTIYPCLSDEDRALIDNVPTAKVMWDTLKRHHQPTGFAFRQQLYSSLSDLSITDFSNDVHRYIAAFNEKREQLTTAGFSMGAEGYVCIFLRGLGTKFQLFRGRKRAELSALHEDVVPSLEHLIEELLEEVRHTGPNYCLPPLPSSNRKRARSSASHEEAENTVMTADRKRRALDNVKEKEEQANTARPEAEIRRLSKNPAQQPPLSKKMRRLVMAAVPHVRRMLEGSDPPARFFSA